MKLRSVLGGDKELLLQQDRQDRQSVRIFVLLSPCLASPPQHCFVYFSDSSLELILGSVVTVNAIYRDNTPKLKKQWQWYQRATR